MKSLLFLSIMFLVPLVSFGRDVNVCNTLANVISMNQDRFDQAEIALSDIDAICKNDAQPSACAKDIKKEYVEAKSALEKSQADYKSAGCEQ